MRIILSTIIFIVLMGVLYMSKADRPIWGWLYRNRILTEPKNYEDCVREPLHKFFPGGSCITRYQKGFQKPSTTSTVSRKERLNTPSSTVQSFYEIYIACENASPSGDSIICTDSIKEFLASGFTLSGLKPETIMCAQNIPIKVTVDNVTISGNTSRAVAHHFYETSGDNQITINLSLENGLWKISHINCQATQI